MKLFAVALIFCSGLNSFAATVCTDFNTETRVAREAVKSLVALAGASKVTAYYGGVQDSIAGVTVVNVQPHYEQAKDWYKVSVRNTDCRVLSVTLFQENLPRD